MDDFPFFFQAQRGSSSLSNVGRPYELKPQKCCSGKVFLDKHPFSFHCHLRFTWIRTSAGVICQLLALICHIESMGPSPVSSSETISQLLTLALLFPTREMGKGLLPPCLISADILSVKLQNATSEYKSICTELKFFLKNLDYTKP